MIRSSFILLLLLAVACDDLAGPGDLVHTQLDDVVVTQRVHVVSFTIHNQSHHTVYLSRCGDRPIVLVEADAGLHWTRYGSEWCPTFLRMDPMPLGPFASIEGTVSFAAGGRYRLRAGFMATWGEQFQFGRPSEPFWLR